MNVYCELYSCKVSRSELEAHSITGIILSGGPNSVYDEGSPHVDAGVWDLVKERSIPLFGICYGMQELAHVFGGRVAPGQERE
jgi:GMP synthase (glutamine-hydrolysing)